MKCLQARGGCCFTATCTDIARNATFSCTAATGVYEYVLFTCIYALYMYFYMYIYTIVCLYSTIFAPLYVYMHYCMFSAAVYALLHVYCFFTCTYFLSCTCTIICVPLLDKRYYMFTAFFTAAVLRCAVKHIARQYYISNIYSCAICCKSSTFGSLMFLCNVLMFFVSYILIFFLMSFFLSCTH